MPAFNFDLTAPRYTIGDEEILDAIRTFAAHHNNRPFTMREFDAWRERPFVSALIIRRFGRWRDGLARAGIHGGRSRKYKPEELIANLEAVWKKLGRPPGHNALVRRGPIGFGPYIRVWGSLRNACTALAAYHSGKITRKALLAGSPARQKQARARKTIPTELRWQILKRDRYRCCACGRSPATHPHLSLEIDHIRPLARGGSNAKSNLQTLCNECNRGKGDDH
jgi:hypothetical protein